MKLPDLVHHLSHLASKGMALGPLLGLLLPQLASCLLDRKLYVKIALSMVKSLPLGTLSSSLLVCLQCACTAGLWHAVKVKGHVVPKSSKTKRNREATVDGNPIQLTVQVCTLSNLPTLY